ncbi:MAG TPA: PAS domain S-box protein [Chitinophagaceae bacterium]|nr:PAS domain S-box protein [Chitinophagaceae bacterium]
MKPAEIPIPEFLSEGGEMGQYIRNYDWSKTPLGDPFGWPQSLRSTLSICLNSNFPIAIYWGNDLTLLYNDAWSPIPGDKHPWALGRPAKEVWPEIWEAIEPQFKKAFNGKPGGSTDALLPMHRHGYTEECYFNFTFTPIYGEGGKVEGVFNAVIETTKTVLNERQLQTLHELGNLDRTSKTVDDVLEAAAKVLEKNNKDFPFGIIYKIVEEENRAVPISYVGTNDEQKFFPSSIDLSNPTNNTENFYKAYSTNTVVVSENKGTGKNLPKGGWDVEATHFIHLPIANQNRKSTVAIFAAALNPYRRFDGLYQQFVQLMADQISTEVNNALAYEEERKRAEALAEIDKAKTAFFTNISHEFRTPLTLMLGSLEGLLSKKNDEIGSENKEAIETSHRNAVRMLRLVNNLLDFSRIEAGRVKARFQLTDISRYTTELASTFRSVIENGGLQFHVHCDHVIQPVYVDKEMWEKIVLNLLSNAFKYTLTGSIDISLTSENGRATLKVRDTGIGIPETELPKMFQRFHRVQNVTGRTYEGTGIGLSLVKELVQLHGGEISVTSKVHEGTEFTVAIPTGKHHLPAENVVEKDTDSNIGLSDAFIEEADSLITKPATARGNAIKDAPTILVVDDNADMRQYLRNFLQEQYNVITANNGMDALHKLNDHPVDLIVSDIMMPVMDGIELLKTIKARPNTSACPVILLSARAGEEARVEGFDIGADDYLVKPFSTKELTARVASQIHLAKRRNNVLRDMYRLFDGVPFAIVALKGEALVIEYINQHNLDIWQRTREEVLGKPLFEARPDIRDDAEPVHQEVYRTGKRFVARELPITLTTNGKTELRYFDIIIDPMVNEQGQVVGQLATSIDVTEQVVARKKTESSEKQFRNILLDSPSIFVVLKGFPEMVIEFANEPLFRSWGRTADIIGKPLLEVLPEIKDQPFPKLLEDVFRTGKPYYSGEEKAVLMKDGLPIDTYYVFTYQPIFDDHKKVTGITIMANDITEQVLARKKVEETFASLQLQSLVLEKMDEGVSVSDENGIILFTNPSEDKMFGYEPGELIGQHVTIQNAYPPKENEKIVADVIFELKTNGFWSGEWHNRKKDGTEFYSHSFITSLVTEGKTMFVCVQRDITETKKTEVALKESEEQFRNFSNNIQNLAWIADGEGWIYWYNQRWYEYTGTTLEEMQGWGWQKVHHPDHVDYVVNYVKDAWKRPEPFEMIFPLKSKYGEYRWFLTRCVPISDDHGNITRWIGTNTDIHDQKIAEEKLREKEKNLQSAKDQLEITFQNIPAAVYLLNSKGEMLYLNERGARLFGDYTAAEILKQKDLASLIKRGEEIYDRYNENGEPLEFRDSPASVVLRTGKPASRVLKVIRKETGEVIWFFSQASPLLDEDGNVSLVLGTATDITSQKQAEEIIRESESRFRTLAETLPQMIWVRTMDGSIEYGSKSWEEYCGIRDVREAWRTITHPEDWEPVMSLWQKSMEEGNAFNCEVRLRNKEGEYRWHYAVGEPVRDASGTVIKYIGALTDIHVQKTFSEKLEKLVAERTRELANLNMELQRSNEDLQQFAHVASHDLKEPVRKVRTFNGRLSEEFSDVLPDKAKSYIKKVENAAVRMYSMIDGVLLYSSLTAMQQPIEEVNLNETIRQIEADLEIIINQKNATIKHGRLPTIEGSSILIYQLFYNLINNSLKFAKADVPPVIEISQETINGEWNRENGRKEYIRITVEDNGIGFNDAQKEEIFKTFSRLNPKDKYEGTGLGLALCKKIVERYGGIISATGKPGEGSVFEIVLPVKQ